MQLNFKKIALSEFNGIVNRIQGYSTPDRKPLEHTELTSVSLADEKKARDCLPPFLDVCVDIDEKLLGINQATKNKKIIEDCLLANQNW